MTKAHDTLPLIDDELDVLTDLVPLAAQDIIELGCGAAKLSRASARAPPDSRVTGLEVDERQHAKNLAAPQDGPAVSSRPAPRRSPSRTRASIWR